MTKGTSGPKRPLKVAYIHPQFPEKLIAFSVGDKLALGRLGHEVSVHSLRPALPNWQRTLQDVGLGQVRVTHPTAMTFLLALFFILRHPIINLHMVHLIVSRCRRHRTHLIKSLATLPRSFEIFASIEANPPDVVHAFWGHYPSLVIYMVKRFLPQVPATLFLGAYDMRMKYPISADTAQIADAIFTHAEVNRADIEAMGAPSGKLHVIRRGLDLRPVRAAEGKEKRRQHVVTVSRLSELKRVDLLLRTFGEIQKEWPKATLAIVGDGPERASLEALAKDLKLTGVTFTGAVPRDEVLPYMAEAPVFLFMSPKERLPNVLKEAMAIGCICVTTYSDGLEELIPSPEHGFILQGDPVEEGARIVGQLFSGEIDPTPIRARARDQIEAFFDVDRAMANYAEVWRAAR